MKKMTKFSTTTIGSIMLMALSGSVFAAVIAPGTTGFENTNTIYTVDSFLGSSNTSSCTSTGGLNATNCNFHNYNSPTLNSFISNSQLETDLTDADVSSYVFSSKGSAWVDLGFSGSSYNVYNGDGDDLVVYLAGNAFSIEMEINGITNRYDVTTDDVVLSQSDSSMFYTIPPNGIALSAIFVELSDFNMDTETALTSMRMTLGMDLGSEPNAKYGPGLSLVGGFHNEPTAVPLPLPIVLFASGLGLLGAVARRNKSRA
jgi:hypothetical protein